MAVEEGDIPPRPMAQGDDAPIEEIHMMPVAFLRGLHFGETFMPGVFTVDDYRGAHSTRFVGSYDDLRASKQRIFALAFAVSRQRERATDWQVHHIVERRHLADVDVLGTLAHAYEAELPCVLIHNDTEHKSYTSTLGSREGTALFRSGLPRRLEDRSALAQRRFATTDGRNSLRVRARLLGEMYDNHYEGDPPLQRIARNVWGAVLQTIG